MNARYISKIATELKVQPRQVAATAQLFAEGATVPFIARYRKEATGSLDEVAITNIRERLISLAELDQRREPSSSRSRSATCSPTNSRAAIAKAETLTALEDIYQPYRPKRRTRATIAKEQGLEPLADLLFQNQQSTADPLAEARRSSAPRRASSRREAALAGARDILAERVSDDARARARLRELFWSKGVVRSKVMSGKEEEGAKFKDYFDWSEPRRQDPEPSPAGHPPRRDGGHSDAAHHAAGGGGAGVARAAVRHRPRSGGGAGPARRAGQLQAAARLGHRSRSAPGIQETRRRRSHPGVRREPARTAAGLAAWAARTCWPSTPASAPAARSSASTARASCCTTT